MAAALKAIAIGPIIKLHSLTVMPQLAEIVLAQYVSHHFRRQLFPYFATGFGVARIIEQIGGGDFIHRPAHFKAGKLPIFRYGLGLQTNETMRMRRRR